MMKRTRWTDEENEIASKKFLQSIALPEDEPLNVMYSICAIYI